MTTLSFKLENKTEFGFRDDNLTFPEQLNRYLSSPCAIPKSTEIDADCHSHAKRM